MLLALQFCSITFPFLSSPFTRAKASAGKLIEKSFLHIQVVLKILVIIEVVPGQVGENSPFKFESANAILVYGMGRDLHKTVFASQLNHLPEVSIDLKRIRGGMGSRKLLLTD